MPFQQPQQKKTPEAQSPSEVEGRFEAKTPLEAIFSARLGQCLDLD